MVAKDTQMRVGKYSRQPRDSNREQFLCSDGNDSFFQIIEIKVFQVTLNM